MFHGHEADVLIVGGGPVGLMTALMLAERGISVEVIDEGPGVESHNYAVMLHPSALRLLDEVGLANRLLAAGTRVDKVVLCDREGPRASLHLGELRTDFPFLLTLPRMTLERALEERLAERKVVVRWSQRLASIAQETGHLTCTVERLGRDSVGYAVPGTVEVVEAERRLTPRYVVGADGFFSTVRRRLGIELDSAGPAQGYAPTEFSTDFDLKGEMRVILDDPAAALMFPLPGGRCRFTLALSGSDIPPADSPYIPLGTRLHPGVPSSVFARALHALAPWYDGIRTEITWAGQVRFEPSLTRRFGVERVWLAGDAAHVTGPVGSQSLNEGLREAHDLGSRLARVLASQAPTSLLEQYHAQRSAEWRSLLGFNGGLRASAAATAWVAKNVDRLRSCIPATGADLGALARQVGLELVVG